MLLHDVEGEFCPNRSEVPHRTVEVPMFGMPLLHLILEVFLDHHWIVRSTTECEAGSSSISSGNGIDGVVRLGNRFTRVTGCIEPSTKELRS